MSCFKIEKSMVVIMSRSGFYWILEAVLSNPIDCLWTNGFITLIFVFH